MSVWKKEYSLSFDEYDQHIRSSWQQLQFEEQFYDATLACKDKQIRVNKFVISCSSPVLKNIFVQSVTHINPVIYLRGVAFENLQNIIHFIHQGEVKVAESDLSSFFLCVTI